MYSLRKNILSILLLSIFALSPCFNLISADKINPSNLIVDKGERKEGVEHRGYDRGSFRRGDRDEGRSFSRDWDRDSYRNYGYRNRYNSYGLGFGLGYGNGYGNYYNYSNGYNSWPLTVRYSNVYDYNDANTCYWYQDSYSRWYYSCNSYYPSTSYYYYGY
jgi:hypothetical protein